MTAIPTNKESKEVDQDLADEEADEVADMPPTDFFDRRQQPAGKFGTTSSANEFFKGRQRAG